MMTEIISINNINPEISKIRIAASVIKNGGIVVFPTETVYGMGANAFDINACQKIFDIKNRPMDNPLIVHIYKMEQLHEVAMDVSEDVQKTLRVLWPGPITFIFRKNSKVPNEVTGGLGTVAVRMPAHPIALRLIEESGTPIAAPSANIASKPSPTKARHAVDELNGKVDMIIDGGDALFGIESTIINLTSKPYSLLRPGAFTVQELERYFGEIEIPKGLNKPIMDSDIALAPGTKYKHYSPEKMLVAIEGRELMLQAIEIVSRRKKIAVLCSNELAEKLKGVKTIKLGSEKNLYEIAQSLFDSFRILDKLDVDIGLIQSFSQTGMGLAVMNRIIKASGEEPLTSIEQVKEKF